MIEVGVIATTMRIFDAVTDPIVGGLSDRSKGHCGFGRRRFCIAVAFVPFAVSWFLQFTVPFVDKVALFWWYLGSSLVANWCWTWVMIPSVALLQVISLQEVLSFSIALALYPIAHLRAKV